MIIEICLYINSKGYDRIFFLFFYLLGTEGTYIGYWWEVHENSTLWQGRAPPSGMPVWCLARYCVHTTATWDQFWNIIKKVRNHSDGVFLVFPWLIESGSYKKIKSGTSHITNHTSHITYYIGICLFYKILVINTHSPIWKVS